MRSPRTLGLAAAAAASVLVTSVAGTFGAIAAGPEDVLPTRAAAPIVLTGAQLPEWSRLAATGTPNPYPSGALIGERSAHNGTFVVPPDTRSGVDAEKVAAYKWDGARFVEVPVQVDQRFPYFLANPDSEFGIYSGTDTELTYQWDTESWKKTAGKCSAEYPEGEGRTDDPVPTLDDDDEIVVMASDTGSQAPRGELGPLGTEAGTRQEVAVVDPLNGHVTYVYLFLRNGGSKATGYVRYERDVDADQWIDRTFFADDDPEKLGSSNTGYGPNLSGTVCHPVHGVRPSTDRFPRDGVTVSTASYKWRASGRWMVRGMQVAKPGQPFVYGPDLVDRWKGRAFQSSPDSSISVVGFEDEQVNWEANSTLLGERVGPVRAIRETWGADSGTNVTKTETFYRDAVTYRYRLRVHPIPSDGLYTSWDYNAGVATRYFNALKPEGVDIDGIDDEAYGNVDQLGGQPAFFDAPDATHDLPVALLKWEQVSGAGDNGSLVYVLENKGPTTLTNPAVVPFYRDDKCFDDGTGDDPVPRPWPGDATVDPENPEAVTRVQQAYMDRIGATRFADVPCDERQGAWGSHGVHFFATWDTDNLFVGTPVPVNETDAQQWQFAVPTAQPKAVGEPFAQDVRVPLVAAAVSQPNVPATHATSVEVTGALEGQATDGVTLSARLVDADDDVALAGEELLFSLQGETWSATTGDDGVATVDVAALAGPAGPTPLEVRFAGDASYHASSSTETFTVREEDASMRISMTSLPGLPTTITATLTETDTGDGLAGRSVSFTVQGTVVGTRTTDDTGRATLALGARPKKDEVIEASFGGDGTFAAASARLVVPKR